MVLYIFVFMKKCSKCKEIKNFEEFSKNKNCKDGFEYQCKGCKKKYYEENKEQIKVLQKKYNERNKERIRGYRKKHLKENKEQRNERDKKKRDDSPLLKLRINLRSRTYQAFKHKNIKKNSRTHEMLGIEWTELKFYIEDMFTEGMTWDNYGEWHIDHIYPLSKAKDEKHLKELCHYSNLQPLWAEDNMSKGDKIL